MLTYMLKDEFSFQYPECADSVALSESQRIREALKVQFGALKIPLEWWCKQRLMWGPFGK